MRLERMDENMSLAERNIELVDELTKAQDELRKLKTCNQTMENYRLDKELRTLKQVIKKVKYEHQKEYKTLWRQHQVALQKLQMINDFTQDTTKIYPVINNKRKGRISPVRVSAPTPGGARSIPSPGVSYEVGK